MKNKTQLKENLLGQEQEMMSINQSATDALAFDDLDENESMIFDYTPEIKLNGREAVK